MASIEATAIAFAIALVVLLLPTSHGFNAIVRHHRICRDRLPAGALRATEEFQRSLLEAQFSNSSPDVAPKIDDVATPAPAPAAEANPNGMSVETIQNSLLRIAASTDRGQNANAFQREMARNLLAELESKNKPTWGKEEDGYDARVIPSHLTGTWELLYSNTQLFRSSPFFLAGRSTCRTPDQAKQYDWFCDMHRSALSISNVGTVRQIISRDGRLVNEFEVKVGSVPFLSDILPSMRYSGGLPFTINGAIVSTADVTPIGGSSWELYMDTVEIKGSNVPLLRNLLDSESVALKSRDLSRVLEENVDSYDIPKPVLRTTYVDDNMRITRDMDDNVYVYGRASNSEVPTDYSSVLPDLGVASLLEGFNDAVTKIYL